ncbi:hypothetical protein FOMPIDRAFT_92994 [Fomitopsis schrenkii]|uniref:Transmembrane protein n=1 Tax=Fomitopsis schrenkii TaxID=2126942 RepID=S8E0J9_FOMSC|nr:hypothetical protein FOMPIDRAFT_92994 [Fomitopsis schrenkii]
MTSSAVRPQESTTQLRPTSSLVNKTSTERLASSTSSAPAQSQPHTVISSTPSPSITAVDDSAQVHRGTSWLVPFITVTSAIFVMLLLVSLWFWRKRLAKCAAGWQQQRKARRKVPQEALTISVPESEEDAASEKAGESVSHEHEEYHTLWPSLGSPALPTLVPGLPPGIPVGTSLLSLQRSSTVTVVEDLIPDWVIPIGQGFSGDAPSTPIDWKLPTPQALNSLYTPDAPQFSGAREGRNSLTTRPLQTYSPPVNDIPPPTLPPGIRIGQPTWMSPGFPPGPAPAITHTAPEGAGHQKGRRQGMICAVEPAGQIASYRLRALPPPPYVDASQRGSASEEEP